MVLGLSQSPTVILSRPWAPIALCIARGMDYLHGQYVVHLDLKCDKLLCGLRDPQRPVIKIWDMGLSKVGGERKRRGVGWGQNASKK